MDFKQALLDMVAAVPREQHPAGGTASRPVARDSMQ
jgi:hypothetical protein